MKFQKPLVTIEHGVLDDVGEGQSMDDYLDWIGSIELGPLVKVFYKHIPDTRTTAR